MTHRAARLAVVVVRTCTALRLHVPASIFRIRKVGYPRVHHRVYLLHAPTLRVVVEVCPCQAARRRAVRHARPQLFAHYRAAHHGAQISILMHPFRLHVLYLVAVRQHHHIKLRRVQYREV